MQGITVGYQSKVAFLSMWVVEKFFCQELIFIKKKKSERKVKKFEKENFQIKNFLRLTKKTDENNS